MKRSLNSKFRSSEPSPIRRQPTSVRETVIRMPTLQLAKIEPEERSTCHEKTATRLPLPGYDVRTKRVESGAFFLLGLVGISLIVLAGGNAVEFSENRDSIATALVSPPAPIT